MIGNINVYGGRLACRARVLNGSEGSIPSIPTRAVYEDAANIAYVVHSHTEAIDACRNIKGRAKELEAK